MRKIIFIFLFLSLSLSALADTVYLKGGQVIKGKILEESRSFVTLDVGGAPAKYYMNQVDRIEKGDEKPLSAISIDLLKFPTIPKQKVELIVNLLVANRTRSGMEVNLQNILSKIPEDKKEEVKQLFNLDEIIERIIPIYDKYFTEVELKGLLDFYNGPLGQKFLDVSPSMAKDVVDASINYFKEKNDSLHILTPAK